MALGSASTEPLRYGTDFKAASEGDVELRTATLFQRRPNRTAALWINGIGKIR